MKKEKHVKSVMSMPKSHHEKDGKKHKKEHKKKEKGKACEY